MESEPTELHIILREVEDERFPGVRGIEISISPDREGIALEDLSRVELTAIQMIQLFHEYQKHTGAVQLVDGRIIEADIPVEAEIEWPEEVEV